jgi:hypothetical protein
VRHDDGSIVAVCQCESWNCEDLELKEEELVLLGLSWSRLGFALATAFGCERREASLGLPGVIQIGSFGGAGLPVVLSIQSERAEFRSTLAELIVRLRGGFIVLAPTSRFFDVRTKELMADAKAGLFDLESHVSVLASGKLQARKSGGELFAGFLPEKSDAIKESDGKRVFAIFKRLATDKSIIKAPLETVFRLTVLEGRSQARVAKDCKCVPALISRRVKTIESRFGMSVEQLRNFASTILEMETSVKRDRYQKRKGGNSSDETAGYGGGAERADLVEDEHGYLPEERAN